MYLVKTLKKRKDFLKVMKVGHKIVCPSFILFFLPINYHTPIVKFGYTVSSKVGGAVIRNKVKRRLRNIALSTLKEQSNIIKPNNNFNSLIVCFVAKHNAQHALYKTMQEDFFNAIKTYNKTHKIHN